MTINLTGKNERNEINLTGKNHNKMSPNYKINNLKKYILKNYIIPLYSEQWQIINNNKLLLDETINQTNMYYKLYKLDDLAIFLELLKIFKILIDKNDMLIDLNLKDKAKRAYDKNSIISMVYKTTKIRILPEYELYNSILGKPNKQTPYNESIINDIKTLMTRPNITYDAINEYLHTKYVGKISL
jgi:hypothetical protein